MTGRGVAVPWFSLGRGSGLSRPLEDGWCAISSANDNKPFLVTVQSVGYVLPDPLPVPAKAKLHEQQWISGQLFLGACLADVEVYEEPRKYVLSNICSSFNLLRSPVTHDVLQRHRTAAAPSGRSFQHFFP